MWHEYGEMVSEETSSRRKRRNSRPLDDTRLKDLALAYVARFATSSGKLADYLRRKIRERGFEGEPPDIDALVQRYVELGYIDDEAFARTREEGLRGRGYGARRVEQALRAAGIEEGIRAQVAPSEYQARHAAYRFAERRRFGPFGGEVDRDRQQKQIAAMVRAGHSFDAARAMVEARDTDSASEWVAEAEGMD